jgi:D-serine deaminase-like pyridoxal phosphate-dependent protein
MEPHSFHDLETPAALVDVERLQANLASAGAYCRRWGLHYRPHAKSHKSSELALKQVEAGAVGVAVATPREAEVMAGVVDDVLVAYPLFGGTKLARLLAVPDGVRLSVALDSTEALSCLAAAARGSAREVGVLVEIDVGLRRVGLQTIDQTLRLAAEAARTRGVHYRGIAFYPGHIRVPVPEQTAAIQALSQRLEHYLEALAAAGLEPEIVSGGSTPTLPRSHEIEGMTEIRAGTAIFNDRTTALLGACAWTECAYSVLATVVSTSVPGQAVVDAGSKALAKEEVRASFQDPGSASGFACVLDRPDLRVTALSEEHGVIDLKGSDWRPRPGDLVRVVPNHVCVSVNLFEKLWQLRGDRIVGQWRVEARGR